PRESAQRRHTVNTDPTTRVNIQPVRRGQDSAGVDTPATIEVQDRGPAECGASLRSCDLQTDCKRNPISALRCAVTDAKEFSSIIVPAAVHGALMASNTRRPRIGWEPHATMRPLRTRASRLPPRPKILSSITAGSADIRRSTRLLDG